MLMSVAINKNQVENYRGVWNSGIDITYAQSNADDTVYQYVLSGSKKMLDRHFESALDMGIDFDLVEILEETEA